MDTTTQDLGGNDIPDIEGFLAIDKVVDKEPIVINTTAQVGVQEQELTPLEKLKLLNPHNPVKTLVGHISSVKEMGEIVEDLEVKKSITFNDAENVNLVFENFKNQFQLNEFTDMPSRTGLVSVKKFMDKEIKARQERAVNDFNELVLNPFADLQNIFQSFVEKLAPTVSTCLSNFGIVCKQFLADKNNIASQEFLKGNDTINFATTAICELPLDLEVDRNNVQLFLTAVRNLSASCVSEDMQFLLKNVGGLQEEERFLVSLSTLITIFASDELMALTDSLRANAEASMSSLNDIMGDVGTDATEFSAVRDFLVKHENEINDHVGHIKRAIGINQFLQTLYVNTSVVVDFFKT